jgi:hypothetical protein
MAIKRYILHIIIFCLILCLATRCLDFYSPPAVNTQYNYLVMNGFLNGVDSTIITLTRTQTIASTGQPTVETGAIVQIEQEQGGTYPLTASSNGTYFLTPQTWDPSGNYRIRIQTTDGKEYLSDYVPLLSTPAIDSVNWKVENGGVQIFVNTHDPTNKTQYYRWNYEETWEYSTPYYSDVILVDGAVIPRTNDINHCWSYQSSTEILISTTTTLNQAIVSEFPINFISVPSDEFQYEYSILVSQFAMTQDAYQYWSILEKDSEGLGTIFGPLPSQVTGNITCTTNAQQPVLGYFSASSVAQKRIFINFDQVPYGGSNSYYKTCLFDTIRVDDIPTYRGGNLLIQPVDNQGGLIGYSASSPGCVDCRLHGGVNVKPSFWPN